MTITLMFFLGFQAADIVLKAGFALKNLRSKGFFFFYKIEEKLQSLVKELKLDEKNLETVCADQDKYDILLIINYIFDLYTLRKLKKPKFYFKESKYYFIDPENKL